MRHLRAFLRLPALLGLLTAQALPAAAEPVSVFAAASLRGVLEALVAEQETPARLSYGGSGTIARQLAAGAPADLVVLASPDWMDWLAAQGIKPAAPPRTVAGNRLVLIGPKGARPLDDAATLPDRLAASGARLAMGQRAAVPAGAYAHEWLTAAGLWDSIAPHLAETDSVRAALALVARGALPLGVVYATDAQAEPRVDVLYEVPADLHSPITYPAMALTPAGLRLLDTLTTDPARATWRAHGFQAP